MPGFDIERRPDDHEAAMARADLYKLANYSYKLFKMIHDGDELEGWVQAKITKSADYIASVYHYMEYEMKFSEYGNKIENSEMYSEAIREQFKNKLMEAKTKLEKLKEINEEEMKKVGDTKKTAKGGTVTKTEKGVKHEKGDYSDEPHQDEPKKKEKAGMSGAERRAQKAQDKEQEKAGKDWEKRHGKGSVTRHRMESAKPDYLDMDKDGDKKEPMKKAIADKKKGAASKKVDERATGDYSAKKGAAGKDLGKPGKNFAKIADKAGKSYGSKEKGEKVAGAVLAKLRKG